MSTRKTLLSLAVLVVALAGPSLSAQGQTTLKAPPGAILIKGAGATFPSLLYEQWFQRYHKLRPDVVVRYEPVGSGLGVERFIGAGLEEEKLVDFGASDAAMSDAEMARVERGVRLIPMTAGGVALAYNLPGLRGPAQTEPRRIQRHLPREDQELERPRHQGLQSRPSAPEVDDSSGGAQRQQRHHFRPHQTP